jgi:hypothetical protein
MLACGASGSPDDYGVILPQSRSAVPPSLARPLNRAAGTALPPDFGMLEGRATVDNRMDRLAGWNLLLDFTAAACPDTHP